MQPNTMPEYTPSSPIRVIIADDHPVVREGLRGALRESALLTVVGVVTSFDEVLEKLSMTPADVLVLDLSGMQGAPLTVISRIRRAHPSVAIVIFSSTVDLAPELLEAGALGYVAKEELVQQLISAVRAAHRGERFLSPAAAEYIERATVQQGEQRVTKKELVVLKLLAQGLSTTEIATQLGIDPRTAQNYITAARRKLGISERTQLAEWYRRIYGDDAPDP